MSVVPPSHVLSRAGVCSRLDPTPSPQPCLHLGNEHFSAPLHCSFAGTIRMQRTPLFSAGPRIWTNPSPSRVSGGRAGGDVDACSRRRQSRCRRRRLRLSIVDPVKHRSRTRLGVRLTGHPWRQGGRRCKGTRHSRRVGRQSASGRGPRSTPQTARAASGHSTRPARSPSPLPSPSPYPSRSRSGDTDADDRQPCRREGMGEIRSIAGSRPNGDEWSGYGLGCTHSYYHDQAADA